MRKQLSVLIFFALLILLFSINLPLVVAQTPPVQPCSFYGTVKINGENVDVGTPISAKMSGVVVATFDAIDFEGDSVYSLVINGDLSMDGVEILFFVDGIQADQTAAWHSGVQSELNLTVSNQAPVAQPNSYSVKQDAVLNVAAPGVLGNDSDPDGDPLTAVCVSGPSKGTLTLYANGAFRYTPNPGYFGTDSFTYQANDGTVGSNVVTVTITVVQVYYNYLPIVLN